MSNFFRYVRGFFLIMATTTLAGCGFLETLKIEPENLISHSSRLVIWLNVPAILDGDSHQFYQNIWSSLEIPESLSRGLQKIYLCSSVLQLQQEKGYLIWVYQHPVQNKWTSRLLSGGWKMKIAGVERFFLKADSSAWLPRRLPRVVVTGTAEMVQEAYHAYQEQTARLSADPVAKDFFAYFPQKESNIQFMYILPPEATEAIGKYAKLMKDLAPDGSVKLLLELVGLTGHVRGFWMGISHDTNSEVPLEMALYVNKSSMRWMLQAGFGLTKFLGDLIPQREFDSEDREAITILQKARMEEFKHLLVFHFLLTEEQLAELARSN